MGDGRYKQLQRLKRLKAAKGPPAAGRRKTACLLAVMGLFASFMPAVGAQSQNQANVKESSAQDPGFQAIERALATLAEQRQKAEESGDRRALAALDGQKRNLELAKALLEIKHDHPAGSLDATFALARKAMQDQAELYGANAESPAKRDGGRRNPSRAALALAKLYRPSLTAAEKNELKRLDALPQPVKGALARYIEAVSQMVIDARASVGPLEEQQSAQRMAPSGPPSPGTAAKQMLASTGMHPQALLIDRIRMLDATKELVDALRQNPGAARVLSDSAGADKSPAGKRAAPLASGARQSGPTPLRLAAQQSEPLVPEQCADDLFCLKDVSPPECQTEGAQLGAAYPRPAKDPAYVLRRRPRGRQSAKRAAIGGARFRPLV